MMTPETEFFQTCEIYSDSSELNSILVVSDESEPYNFLHYCLTEARAALTTDGWLIKEDPSLKTFWNFIQGKDYLNSSWTDQLHQKHKMLISLETHNPNNVPIYEHFGFKTYGIVEKPHFGLKQYCMIREATV